MPPPDLRLVQELSDVTEPNLFNIHAPLLTDFILGTEGDAVAVLQRQLRVWGFDPGEYTGKLGPATKAAIVALQKKLGLDPTGIFNESTRVAVVDDLNAGAQSILNQTAIVPLGPPTKAKTAPTQVATTSFWDLLKSPAFWAIAGGIAILLASGDSGVKDVEVEGLEDDFDDDPAPRRKKRRKKKHDVPEAKPVAKSKASEAVVDAEVVHEESVPVEA